MSDPVIATSVPSTIPMPVQHAGADRILGAPRGERAELEERGVGIDERLDALPHEQLAAGAVTVDVALPADRRHRRELLGDLVPQPLHLDDVGPVLVGLRVESTADDGADGTISPYWGGPEARCRNSRRIG